MRRLTLAIAILFACASLTVATVSGVFAADNDAAVTTGAAMATPATACDDGLAVVKAPAFKPCGKKVNGLAILCHADPGLLPAALAMPEPSPALRTALLSGPPPATTGPPGLFRPPRAA